MKYRLSHWSKSLVAIVALSGQIPDTLVLTVGSYAGSHSVIDSPLVKPLSAGVDDTLAQTHQLPDIITAAIPVLSPQYSSPRQQTFRQTSYTQAAFSLYLPRAPPISA